MEKLQVDSNNYTLYSPDSLKYITDRMVPILNTTINHYKNLFDIKDYRKFIINYFDDEEKFRDFIYSLRGEKESLPSYAVGTYDNGMINAYIPSNIVIDSPKYISKLYMASHELFHIMYNELILKGDYSKRIVWYDEGMAHLSSGEKNDIIDKDNFKKYLEKVKYETKRIPDLNELEHGSSFCNNDYNGYDLSYLSLRYLEEILSEKEFKSLLNNFEQIKKYGNHVVEDMFAYYQNQR